MAIYVVDGKPRHGKTAWVVSHVPRWMKEAELYGFKLFSNVKIFIEQLKYPPCIEPENIGDDPRKVMVEGTHYALKKRGRDLVVAHADQDCIIGDIYDEIDRENPKKLLYYWRNIQEWNFMQYGRIVADEGQRYFNARRWQQLAEDTEVKLQQHGKEELDIWLTVQHYSRLDTTLRVLVERFFRVERVFGIGNDTLFARVTEHDLEEMTRFDSGRITEEELEGSSLFWIRKKWKLLYDTKARVLASMPMPLKHTVRYCDDPHCPIHKKPRIVHV
jgi:hypothetical protein